MQLVKLTKHFTVTGTADSDEFDAHTDDVMDALMALETEFLFDADVSAELANGVVIISISAAAEEFDDAAAAADSAIRSAIHSAGGHTPNWRTVSSAADLIDA